MRIVCFILNMVVYFNFFFPILTFYAFDSQMGNFCTDFQYHMLYRIPLALQNEMGLILANNNDLAQ